MRAGDGLALAALLGADAGIGAGGVDEGDHRQAELVGQVHQPHRLAVALRPGGAEIVLDAGGGVVALLVADHHHRRAAKPAQPADDGLVVAEFAVAAQLDEILDQAGDVVDEVRPLGMAGDLRLLPAVQVGIGLPAHPRRAVAQGVDLGLEGIGATRLVGELGQLLDLRLELGDRPLEIQVMRGHAVLFGVAVGEAAESRREAAPRQGWGCRSARTRSYILPRRGGPRLAPTAGDPGRRCRRSGSFRRGGPRKRQGAPASRPGGRRRTVRR